MLTVAIPLFDIQRHTLQTLTATDKHKQALLIRCKSECPKSSTAATTQNLYKVIEQYCEVLRNQLSEDSSRASALTLTTQTSSLLTASCHSIAA
jgi:phage host-nuclease inhibitor protein Gam